ncbi:MAG: peptidoglycan editing factor PgeF [Candidatus Uhrbacteria bacterium]
MNIWQSPLLQQVPWLFHATSTKDFGSLRYPNPGDLEDLQKLNRKKFYQEIGIDSKKVIMSGNVHDKKIAIVSSQETGQRIEGCDGLITTEPDLTLAVKTADCLPIFFVDPKNKFIGLVHSGWKGTVKNIAVVAVEEFKKIGSDPTDLLVALGPSIKKCHYDIKSERTVEMAALKKYFKNHNGKIFIDLQAAVVDELLAAGVLSKNIDRETPCTMCEPEKYFSYHLSGKIEESLLSVIVMR